MSTTDSNHPVVQSPRTWFMSWKARPKNLSQNADGSFSARTCYVLHGVLVTIHIILVIFYASHWEHRVTLPFTPMNNDFWPVVLSASLQAFYTIYTAILLFLTQRLAMSRTLVRRLKLTAIHDISGAWAGLGAALSSVWRQIDIPASWWTISAVATYLASISVLHITSSTLLQLQTFNTSTATSIPTTLGWLDDQLLSQSTDPINGANWGVITASLPVVNQLSGLVSAGLSNTTVYDIPQTNSILGHAIVNATTITSRCGLLPNITYSANAYAGVLTANSSLSDGNVILMNTNFPWSDQIQVLQTVWSPPVTGGDTLWFPQSGVLLVVSTLLDIEPSVQEEFAVPITWEFSNSLDVVTSSVLEVYFVQCSLAAVTVEAVLDMQTNSLRDPVSVSQPSAQWEIYQWTSNIWQTAIGEALTSPVDSGYSFYSSPANPTSGPPSIVDEYIMTLVGLNLTAEYSQFISGSPPSSNVTLSLDKLETAIAQVTAQLIWIAGRLGTSNGGIQPGNGMAYVDEDIIALRLNVNLLPLSFATSASVIMMALALYMTRAFHASNDSQAAIPDIGALQLMWLGHHSASVNEVLEDVKHPTEANLRRAGMIDICFAKTITDEDELGSSSDSLSGQNDDSRDDMMRY